MGVKVTHDKSNLSAGQPVAPPDLAAASANIPLIARQSHEIPKPRDWQTFQRNCVQLFRAELNDPNAQEYGRSGQSQRGIDIIGRRNGHPNHYVGVQCRHISKPLKEEVILRDCREALTVQANLKEIIFATTAPEDTGAINAANAVEQRLRSEGYDLTVVVYGWESLQSKIVIHDIAYALFCPSIVASFGHQSPDIASLPDAAAVARVADQIVERMRQAGIAAPLYVVDTAGSNEEDSAIHAKIDTYRDLFKDEKHPRLAEQRLLGMLESESLDDKPWARFRIETNLGAVALHLGREAEAAERFETAHAIRPDDSKALANLALARIIQQRFDEAMQVAYEALNATPRADEAISYLLQAAARSHWQGDPETLIPTHLADSEYADIGLAEFLRHREVPNWADRVLQISHRHSDVDAFKSIRALAILALASDKGAFSIGGPIRVTHAELTQAAEDLKNLAEYQISIDFADEGELGATLNNAAALLYLAGRYSECEALLKLGLTRIPEDLALRQFLARVQVAQGHHSEALETLAAFGEDPESQLLRAELVADENPAAGLKQALAIDANTLDTDLARTRWYLICDLAIRIGDEASLSIGVAGIRELNNADIMADLFEIKGTQKLELNDNAITERLRVLAATIPADVDMVTRFVVAEELHKTGLPEEASMVLEGHVDLSRRSPATALYLQSLAAARRDDAFRRELAAAAPEVRDAPEMLWTLAAHGWNVGDLSNAFQAVDALLSQEPENAPARLLKIEILIRKDQSEELLAELGQPLEDLTWTRLQEQFRIASLLAHFGFIDRAAAFAYRLFLGNRDNTQAWMTLAMLVLEEGRSRSEGFDPWEVSSVASDVAVNLSYDDGEEMFFVVEPDANLRQLDAESWEFDHPLIQTLHGLQTGDRFTDPAGRAGTITKLRHKYVARFHYVFQHLEARFPTFQGFRRVAVDVETPGGLDKLIAEFKARREWIEQEQERYSNGPWSLGILAHRLGMDVIEVANGLGSQGIPIKVAIGNWQERGAAMRAIRQNGQRGCVLDLFTFWTTWRIQGLDVVATTCGPIHLPRSVLDRLRVRRERLDDWTRDGLKTGFYESGNIAFQEIAPEVILKWRDEVDRAIDWVEANAIVLPLLAGEDLPPVLRENLRAGRSDVFDSTVLAMQARVMLLTDDLPMRELHRLIAGSGGSWLHQVLTMAVYQGGLDSDTYIRWTSQLIEAGHDYLGTSGTALAIALRMDAIESNAPGALFAALSKTIGGRTAEPRSHIKACCEFLRYLWSDSATLDYRQPVTGILLRQLVRERYTDYGAILRTLLLEVEGPAQLIEYILGWAIGHFLADAVNSSQPFAQAPAVPTRRRKRGLLGSCCPAVC